ncbi:MAG: outer membrane protein assembly factor BamA [Xanthomonadaceae bacterium]|nr:outer membrane protein assembly factor BamA [Xanthomonadaceae bacterium]MDE2178344.1 outer membrane protein assembly factor BamA [Xanthomonadaceae bacterium]MDE2244876.1 outer membrane protein assembly factor BamA [Xanthomonadaceae bacterium]
MKRIAALILLACLTAKANAFEPFVVSGIRVDGLTRIAPGTVFSYLPVEQGDTLTDARAQEAIRALFRTGFFSDVSLDRQGSILVVTVVERPSIAKIDIRGNKDIKTEELMKGLKQIGLAEGDTFDRLALERVQQELTRQYYNRGKYNVTIDPHVTHLDRNRVAIDIEIREGKAARIKEINIVGNTAYSDKQIRGDFESSTSNWTSWYSHDDQYSREKFTGDLEKLQNFYLDRGYANFAINSTEVAISPDKRDMYIDADVHEGHLYKIADVKLLGRLVLPEAALRRLVLVKPGDTFSRRRIEASTNAITLVLSNIGYAFAKVTPVPKIDKENRTVDLTLFIEPGQRVYVRRIVFKGNSTTEDEVMRREMRQFEGGWYSQAAIDRSKVRLERLGFFKSVEIKNERVPGSSDEVDLLVKVAEEPSGALQFGVGYSQVSGVIGSFSVSERNFLGTGKQVSAQVQQSSFLKQYSLSYLDPYFTDNGVSLGYNASYTELNQGQANIASYLYNTKSFSSYFGIPISETDTINVGLGLSSNTINTYPGLTPQPLIDYQNLLGHRTIHSWTATISYAHDTRNQYFTPTRGGLQSISAEIALPGSTVQYYKLFAISSNYFPLPKSFVLGLTGNVGYGKTYGRDSGLAFPFWQNYYGGGVTDVRGFMDNTLGPRLTVPGYLNAQPIGGAFKVLGRAELFLPLPFLKDSNTARVSLFYDTGNVFSTYNQFAWGQLRSSVGIGLQWRAPIGPINISYAMPIKYNRVTDAPFIERFQFTFGSTF